MDWITIIIGCCLVLVGGITFSPAAYVIGKRKARLEIFDAQKPFAPVGKTTEVKSDFSVQNLEEYVTNPRILN